MLRMNNERGRRVAGDLAQLLYPQGMPLDGQTEEPPGAAGELAQTVREAVLNGFVNAQAAAPGMLIGDLQQRGAERRAADTDLRQTLAKVMLGEQAAERQVGREKELAQWQDQMQGGAQQRADEAAYRRAQTAHLESQTAADSPQRKAGELAAEVAAGSGRPDLAMRALTGEAPAADVMGQMPAVEQAYEERAAKMLERWAATRSRKPDDLADETIGLIAEIKRSVPGAAGRRLAQRISEQVNDALYAYRPGRMASFGWPTAGEKDDNAAIDRLKVATYGAGAAVGPLKRRVQPKRVAPDRSLRDELGRSER